MGTLQIDDFRLPSGINNETVVATYEGELDEDNQATGLGVVHIPEHAKWEGTFL